MRHADPPCDWLVANAQFSPTETFGSIKTAADSNAGE